MHHAPTAVTLCVLTALLPCTAQEPAQEPAAAGAEAVTGQDPAGAQVRAGNDFAFALLRELGAGNQVVSPHSLRAAFALAWAATDGRSHAEIGRVLGFGSGEVGEERVHAALAGLRRRLGELGGKALQLQLANRLWGSDDDGYFEETFLTLARRHYGAALGRADFDEPERARAAINGWVAEQTGEHVRELLPAGAVTPRTTLVITDAIWFRGLWQLPFDRQATRDRPFRAGGDAAAAVAVPTMHQQGELATARARGCTAVALPYVGDELRMVLMLPDLPADAAVDAALPALLQRLDAAGYDEVRAALRPAAARLALPRFRLQQHYALHEAALPELGVQAPFAFSHDWTPLNGDREELRMSGVFHGAAIEVDELGTEAAAATGVVIEKRARPREIAFDRPFLFTVEHVASGAVLFLGVVTDPRGGAE